MAKNDTNQDYSWDSGTYQTGATKEEKRQSGVITALLMAVIFLGGLASALGLMNVRLLSQLMEKEPETVPVLPVSVDSTKSGEESFFSGNREQLPKIPEARKVEFVLGGASGVVPAEPLAAGNLSCLATMTVKTAQGQVSVGPALVISEKGFLLTNAHLLEQGGSITVGLHDGRSFTAAPVATDVYSDLAVIYIDADDLTPAIFADGKAHIPTLYALVDGESLSLGEMRTYSLNLTVGPETLTLMQTDFATDHGPVFNEFGQAEGFLCRYFGREDRGMMLSGAQVMEIAEALAEQGKVSGRPGLGLQMQNLSAFGRKYWKLSHGVEITALEENSPAEAAGLMEGDILLTVDGNPITDLYRLYAAMRSAGAGERLTLEVFRAGKTFAVTLPVTANP